MNVRELVPAVIVAFVVLAPWVLLLLASLSPKPAPESVLMRLPPRRWSRWHSRVTVIGLWLVFVASVGIFAWYTTHESTHSSDEVLFMVLPPLFLSGLLGLVYSGNPPSGGDALITNEGFYLWGIYWRWTWYNGVSVERHMFMQKERITVTFSSHLRWPLSWLVTSPTLSDHAHEVPPTAIKLIESLVQRHEV